VAHRSRSSARKARRTPAEPPGLTTGVWAWLLVFALLGLAASVASTYTHYRLLQEPGYLSFCDVSPAVSCSHAYQSRFGSIAGVPVALLGVIWFGLVMALLVGGRWGPAASRANVGSYVLGLAIVGAGVSIYLAAVSFFVLETLCLLCLTTYVAVLGLLLVSSRAASLSVATLPRRAATDLRTLVSSPGALSVALLVTAAAAAAVVLFPREMTDEAVQAAGAQEARLTDGQRSQFETWFVQQPRVNLPVPDEGARVLIVRFTDYQCPACAQTYFAYRSVLARYRTATPGAVREVTLDFPLNPECNAAVRQAVHPMSCAAAAAVRLGRAHGRGDAMEEWLYANQATLSSESVRAAAREVGGVTDFDARYATAIAAIKADAALGALNGVHSTPTFFINGVRTQPLQPQYFDEAIAMELRRVQK
jgi:uncharacterized membrane protein/protein-disulfide isomerase